jgi:hypothetical protein
MKTRAVGMAVLLLAAAGVASADQQGAHHAGMPGDWLPATADRDDSRRDGRESREWFHDHRASAVAAPEMDPAGVVAAVTLLGGAFAVLRGRRAVYPKGLTAQAID